MTEKFPVGSADKTAARFSNSELMPYAGLATVNTKDLPSDSGQKVSAAGLNLLVDKYLPKIDLDDDARMSKDEIIKAEASGVIPKDLRDELAFLRKNFDVIAPLALQSTDGYREAYTICYDDMRLLTKGMAPYKPMGRVADYSIAAGTGCLLLGGATALDGFIPGCLVGGVIGGVGNYFYRRSNGYKAQEASRKSEYDQRKYLSDKLHKDMTD